MIVHRRYNYKHATKMGADTEIHSTIRAWKWAAPLIPEKTKVMNIVRHNNLIRLLNKWSVSTLLVNSINSDHKLRVSNTVAKKTKSKEG